LQDEDSGIDAIRVRKTYRKEVESQTP